MFIEGARAGISAVAKKAAASVKTAAAKKPAASTADTARAAFDAASQRSSSSPKPKAASTGGGRPSSYIGSSSIAPDRPQASPDRSSGSDRRTEARSEIDALNARAETLRSGVTNMGSGGYAMAAMQEELNAVEADLAARSGPSIDGDAVAGPAFTPSLAAMEGFLPGVVPFSATGGSSDPVHVGGLSPTIHVDERTDGDGNTSIVVTDDYGTELGSYAPGSTIDVEAGAGASRIDVASGADVSLNVETGDGNLYLDIDGGTSDVTVVGNEDDNDIVVSTGGDVTVDGGEGHNVIEVDGANSVDITTGSGHDTISATDIRTTATIDSGDATDYKVEKKTGWLSWAGIGDTEVENVRGSDTVTVGAKGNVEVTTGDGRDAVIVEEASSATVNTGADRDTVDSYGARSSDIDGGSGNDYIRTGNGDDTIHGGGGDDEIYGGDGGDRIYGEGGRDYVDGGRGDDMIEGGADNDILSGNHDDDVIDGGAGDDVLIAGSGTDTLDGGADDGHTVIGSSGPGIPTTVEGGDIAYYQAGDTRTGLEREELSDIPDDFDPQADLQRVNVDDEASDNFRDRVHDDLATLRAIPVGAEGLQLIEDAEGGEGDQHDITITEYDEGSRAFPENGSDSRLLSDDEDGDGRRDANVGSDATIQYNPTRGSNNTTNDDPNDRAKPPIATLYHELAHGYDYVTGQLEPDDYSGPDTVDAATDKDGKVIGNRERDAVGLPIERPDGTTDSVHPEALTENELRAALDLPDRITYR